MAAIAATVAALYVPGCCCARMAGVQLFGWARELPGGPPVLCNCVALELFAIGRHCRAVGRAHALLGESPVWASAVVLTVLSLTYFCFTEVRHFWWHSWSARLPSTCRMFCWLSVNLVVCLGCPAGLQDRDGCRQSP